jgi:hypothetical protein
MDRAGVQIMRESLPSMQEALGSIPSTAGKNMHTPELTKLYPLNKNRSLYSNHTSVKLLLHFSGKTGSLFLLPNSKLLRL